MADGGISTEAMIAKVSLDITTAQQQIKILNDAATQVGTKVAASVSKAISRSIGSVRALFDAKSFTEQIQKFSSKKIEVTVQPKLSSDAVKTIQDDARNRLSKTKIFIPVRFGNVAEAIEQLKRNVIARGAITIQVNLKVTGFQEQLRNAVREAVASAMRGINISPAAGGGAQPPPTTRRIIGFGGGVEQVKPTTQMSTVTGQAINAIGFMASAARQAGATMLASQRIVASAAGGVGGGRGGVTPRPPSFTRTDAKRLEKDPRWYEAEQTVARRKLRQRVRDLSPPTVEAEREVEQMERSAYKRLSKRQAEERRRALEDTLRRREGRITSTIGPYDTPIVTPRSRGELKSSEQIRAERRELELKREAERLEVNRRINALRGVSPTEQISQEEARRRLTGQVTPEEARRRLIVPPVGGMTQEQARSRLQLINKQTVTAKEIEIVTPTGAGGSRGGGPNRPPLTPPPPPPPPPPLPPAGGPGTPGWRGPLGSRPLMMSARAQLIYEKGQEARQRLIGFSKVPTPDVGKMDRADESIKLALLNKQREDIEATRARILESTDKGSYSRGYRLGGKKYKYSEMETLIDRFNEIDERNETARRAIKPGTTEADAGVVSKIARIQQINRELEEIDRKSRESRAAGKGWISRGRSIFSKFNFSEVAEQSDKLRAERSQLSGELGGHFNPILDDNKAIVADTKQLIQNYAEVNKQVERLKRSIQALRTGGMTTGGATPLANQRAIANLLANKDELMGLGEKYGSQIEGARTGLKKHIATAYAYGNFEEQVPLEALTMAAYGKTEKQFKKEAFDRANQKLLDKKRKELASQAEFDVPSTAANRQAEIDRIVSEGMDKYTKSRGYAKARTKAYQEEMARGVAGMARDMGPLEAAGGEQVDLSKGYMKGVRGSGGEQYRLVDPEQAQRVDDLKRQWDKANLALQQAREESLTTGRAQSHHVKIIDQLTGRVVVSERVFFRYGQQVGHIVDEQAKAMAFTNRLGTEFATAAQKVAQWALATGAIYGALRAFRALVTVIKDVDLAMAEMRQVLNPLTTNFSDLQTKSGDMAVKYGSDIATVARTMAMFARQGFDAQQSIMATDKAMLLANTSTLSETDAAKELIAVMRQMGIEASDLGPKIDAISQVAAVFAVEAGDLTKGIARTGRAAANVGVDFDHLLAIIATVGESTQKTGREVGNAYRTIFARGVSKESIKAFKDIGIEVVDSAGNINSFSNTLDQLSQKWDGLTQIQKVNLAQTLGGKHRYNEVLALLDNYKRYTQAVTVAQDSFGSAEYKNAVIMESYSKKVEVMKANFQKLALALGEGGLLDALSLVAKALGGIASLLDKLNSVTGGLAGGLAAGALGVPAMFAAGSFVGHTTGLIQPSKALKSTVEGDFGGFLDRVLSSTGIGTTDDLKKEISGGASRTVDAVGEGAKKTSAAIMTVGEEMALAMKASAAAETAGEAAADTAGTAAATATWLGRGGRLARGARAGIVGVGRAGSSLMNMPIIGLLFRGIGSGFKLLGAVMLPLIKVFLILALAGAALGAVMWIWKKSTESAADAMKKYSDSLQAINQKREVIQSNVTNMQGVTYDTQKRRVASIDSSKLSLTELNNLFMQSGEVSDTFNTMKVSIDEMGRVKIGDTFDEYLTSAEKALILTENINASLDSLSRAKVGKELDAIIDSTNIGFWGEIRRGLSFLNPLKLFNSDKKAQLGFDKAAKTDTTLGYKFLDEMEEWSPDAKDIKNLQDRAQRDLAPMKDIFGSMFRDMNPQDLLRDPEFKDKFARAMKSYGETAAVAAGDVQGVLNGQAYGFRQFTGQKLREQGANIKTHNSVYDQDSYKQYIDTLAETEDAAQKAGRTQRRASEEVILYQGKQRDATTGLLKENKNYSELIPKLKSGMVALEQDTNGYVRQVYVLAKDTSGAIVALDEYGNQIQITDKLLEKLTIVSMGFTNELRKQATALSEIEEMLKRIKDTQEAVDRQRSFTDTFKDYGKTNVEFYQKLGNQPNAANIMSLQQERLAATDRIAESRSRMGAGGIINYRQAAELTSRHMVDLASTGTETGLASLKDMLREDVKPQDVVNTMNDVGKNLGKSLALNKAFQDKAKGFGAGFSQTVARPIQTYMDAQISSYIAYAVSNLHKRSGVNPFKNQDMTNATLGQVMGQLGMDTGQLDELSKVAGFDVRNQSLKSVMGDFNPDDLKKVGDSDEALNRFTDALDKSAKAAKDAAQVIETDYKNAQLSIVNIWDSITKLGAPEFRAFGKKGVFDQNYEEMASGLQDAINKALSVGDIEWAKALKDARFELVAINRELEKAANMLYDTANKSKVGGAFKSTADIYLNYAEQFKDVELKLASEERTANPKDIPALRANREKAAGFKQENIIKYFEEMAKLEAQSSVLMGGAGVKSRVSDLIKKFQGFKTFQEAEVYAAKLNEQNSPESQGLGPLKDSKSIRALLDNWQMLMTPKQMESIGGIADKSAQFLAEQLKNMQVDILTAKSVKIEHLEGIDQLIKTADQLGVQNGGMASTPENFARTMMSIYDNKMKVEDLKKFSEATGVDQSKFYNEFIMKSVKDLVAQMTAQGTAVDSNLISGLFQTSAGTVPAELANKAAAVVAEAEKKYPTSLPFSSVKGFQTESALARAGMAYTTSDDRYIPGTTSGAIYTKQLNKLTPELEKKYAELLNTTVTPGTQWTPGNVITDKSRAAWLAPMAEEFNKYIDDRQKAITTAKEKYTGMSQESKDALDKMSQELEATRKSFYDMFGENGKLTYDKAVMTDEKAQKLMDMTQGMNTTDANIQKEIDKGLDQTVGFDFNALKNLAEGAKQLGTVAESLKGLSGPALTEAQTKFVEQLNAMSAALSAALRLFPQAPQPSNTTAPPQTPVKRHSGGLHLNSPFEFLAVLKRGEAVIPHHLVPELPSNIVDKLPKYHTGAIFDDKSSSFARSILPPEITETFRMLADFVKNIGAMFTSRSSDNLSTKSMEDLLAMQVDLSAQILAESKKFDKILDLIQNDQYMQDTTRKQVWRQFDESSGRQNDLNKKYGAATDEYLRRIELVVSPGADATVNHKVQLDSVGVTDTLTQAIMEIIMRNKDFFLQMIMNSPLPEK